MDFLCQSSFIHPHPALSSLHLCVPYTSTQSTLASTSTRLHCISTPPSSLSHTKEPLLTPKEGNNWAWQPKVFSNYKHSTVPFSISHCQNKSATIPYPSFLLHAHNNCLLSSLSVSSFDQHVKGSTPSLPLPSLPPMVFSKVNIEQIVTSITNNKHFIRHTLPGRWVSMLVPSIRSVTSTVVAHFPPSTSYNVPLTRPHLFALLRLLPSSLL